jgi:glycine/D-amino acid oxidase-like deaminating enzyme
VLLAPATAHHLADWILSGTAPMALAPFGVERLETSTVAGVEAPRT